MIPQMEPAFGEAEARAVADYVRSGAWLTEFTKTRELEERIASFVGARHCCMTPNCTLALYAALACLGVGPGDRVVVPAFTMAASAFAVEMTGAVLDFADISPGSLCLDFESIEEALAVNTRAVLVVDLNGRAPDLDALLALAKNRGFYLVEDAAQAFGSQSGGRHLGTFGAAGCYSFGPLKVISTGQGGCVVTDDDGLSERLRIFKTFGRRGEGHDRYESFGLNLRFTDLQAAVGLVQMQRLAGRLDRKKQIYAMYRERLSDLEPVRFVPTDLACTVPWFVDVLVEEREELARYLKKRGVGSRPFYPALNRTPVYAGYGCFPVAESVSRLGLWLPSAPHLTEAEIEFVCAAIRDYYRGSRT
jgi:perosamine synthetase